MIRNLVENGSKISDIARDLNLERKTVKKYSKSKVVPRYRMGQGSHSFSSECT